MRKLFFLLLLAALTTMTGMALNVNTSAGQLAQSVGNNTAVTSLVVRGTMDARDFLFITDSMNELTSLDLSQATIVPYSQGVALYSTVTNYLGNTIPRTAFFGKKLTSVILPANLETIGYAAFAGCDQLRSITLPATVSMIEDYAFAGTGLTSVEIPQTVIYMGKGVFSRCESLQSVTVNSFTLGDFAFLGDISLNQVKIGSNVNYILRGAFNGCAALTTVDVSEAGNLVRIDEEAFINSGLQSIDVSALNLGTVGDWAFAQTNLSSLLLSDGMTVLGEGALAFNPSLTTVTLPGLSMTEPPAHHAPRMASAPQHTIVNLSDFTFAEDRQLNAGNVLREGVAHIGNYAFYNVRADIDTMRLPSSTTYLGDYAMAGMTGMKTLKTKAVEVPALGQNVWAGVDQQSVPLFTPNDESTELYKAADQWMNFFFGTIVDFIPGDVNNDGLVDISDATALINYLLTGTDNINLLAADLNNDGLVDISDATALINYLLTGQRSMSLQRIRASIESLYSGTADQLGIVPFALRPNETRTVDVALTNDEHIYTAMQFNVILPQGVELLDINGVDRGSSHRFFILKHEGQENVYSVIAISMDMATFDGNEGLVMRLTIAADDEFNTTGATVMFTNVMLVSTEQDVYHSNDAVTKINDESGVEQVTVGKQVVNVRYINVAGLESENPFSGVNIVVTTYDDGTVTTTKVVK